tara:strand:+ start:51 stop:485 length:435 start_codon:yes stop_codon:yes gene_type:complete
MIFPILITFFVVPAYTSVALLGPPALVGWILKRIQKALGRISPRSTYLRRRVFAFVWCLIVLYFVYATIWQIDQLWGLPYDPRMARSLIRIVIGCILEWLTVLLIACGMLDTEIHKPSKLASLITPYSKLSAEAIKDLEERPNK